MAGQGGNTPVGGIDSRHASGVQPSSVTYMSGLLLLLLLLQVVPGTDLFNQMPSEVVLLVFKWLPKCTLAKSARGESALIIKNL